MPAPSQCWELIKKYNHPFFYRFFSRAPDYVISNNVLFLIMIGYSFFFLSFMYFYQFPSLFFHRTWIWSLHFCMDWNPLPVYGNWHYGSSVKMYAMNFMRPTIYCTGKSSFHFIFCYIKCSSMIKTEYIFSQNNHHKHYVFCELTYSSLVTHMCINELGHHWFRHGSFCACAKPMRDDFTV